MYIGQMSLWFTNAAILNGINEEDEIQDLVDNQAQIFGFIQVLCVVWALPIGQVLDRKLDNVRPDPPKANLRVTNRDDDENVPLTDKNNNETVNGDKVDEGITYGRVQKLRNTRDAYIITVACLIVFGVVVIMQARIKLQIAAFILHTVIRTFIHSSAAGIYVNVFHMSHIGKLTGLGSIAGAIFSLVMDPLMKYVNTDLGGNPYKLNIFLIFASLAGGLLPIYLHWFANKTEKEYKKAENR